MRSIITKIRERSASSRGATIAFALFTVLICTLFAGIMLTAVSAAAGRTKNLPETDRRYYSVMSAAKLMREALGTDGGKLVLTRTKTETKTVTTKYEDDGVTVTKKSSSSASDYEYAAKFSDGRAINDRSLATQLTTLILFGRTFCSSSDISLASKEGYDIDNGSQLPMVSSGITKSFTITPTSNDTEFDTSALQVDVEAVLGANGVMTLTLTSSNGSDSYSVEMDVECVVLNIEGKKTTKGNPQVKKDEGSDKDYTKVTIDTIESTKTTEISWNITSVRKVES